MSTDRRAAAISASVAAFLVLFSSGCTIPERNSGDASAAPTSPAVVAPSSPTTPTTTQVASKLSESFDELRSTLAGSVGIAIAPVGTGADVVTLGDWTTGPAWSTIKVPLAIAAVREGDAAATTYAQPAITRSDNDAAEHLWELLGTPPVAAKAVADVLKETGDTTTTVQQEKVRPEFSAFGQTQWSMNEQVRFAADLPCLPQAAPIIDLMGMIALDQQWGLSAFEGAKYKGGWGPDTAGGYLVRQLGVVNSPSGQTAIALAVQPKSGSFADGTKMISQLAQWLTKHSAELPGGTCH